MRNLKQIQRVLGVTVCPRPIILAFEPAASFSMVLKNIFEWSSPFRSERKRMQTCFYLQLRIFPRAEHATIHSTVTASRRIGS
jgi:hypothetical protein